MELGLDVLADPAGGGARSFSFGDGPINCGRSTKNHIVFGDRTVSRTQVVMERVPSGWQITHHGSLTPTLVNGRPLQKGVPTPLRDGDELQVEGFRARLSVGPAGGSQTREPETLYAEPPTVHPGGAHSAPAWGNTASRASDSDIPRLQPEPSSLRPPAPAPPVEPARPAPGPSGRAIPTLVATVPGVGPVRLEMAETDRPYTVGRASACDLTLEANSVSRRHAQFRFDGINVYVRDVGARNPIRVNGVPSLGEVPLNDGDQVKVGTIELTLQTGAGAPAMQELPAAPPPPAAQAPLWEAPPAAPAAPSPPVAPVAAAPKWEDEPQSLAPGGVAPEWGTTYDASSPAVPAAGSADPGLPAPPPKPAFGGVGSAPGAPAGPEPASFEAPGPAPAFGAPAVPRMPRMPVPPVAPAMPVVPAVPRMPVPPVAPRAPVPPRAPVLPAVPVVGALPKLPPSEPPAEEASPAAAAGAAPAATSSLDYRPQKRPPRRGKGWLVAGVVSMTIALVVGFILLL